ncbi:MAG: hypothetical protein OEL57_00260 [Trichlorobacter sp.]|uniref:hypothetical protein n=1 Tax=Trichlorobacter sp. TaxID=2911007 RepID=UPI002563BD5E|nr:hypothetical protein [Trichlorobacter sp.]MDK9716322.1 hypothetical protein [Trichlorobacter sp.]
MRVLFAGGLIIALLVSAGCGKSKENYEKSFKEGFLKSFVTSCSEGATKASSSVKAEQAKSMCECMGKYMVDKYSAVELTKMSANPDSPEMGKIFQEAAASCK